MLCVVFFLIFPCITVFLFTCRGVGSACTVKPTHIRFVSSSEEGSPKKGPTHIRFVSSSEEESPNGPNGDETRNRDDENDDDQT